MLRPLPEWLSSDETFFMVALFKGTQKTTVTLMIGPSVLGVSALRDPEERLKVAGLKPLFVKCVGVDPLNNVKRPKLSCLF